MSPDSGHSVVWGRRGLFTDDQLVHTATECGILNSTAGSGARACLRSGMASTKRRRPTAAECLVISGKDKLCTMQKRSNEVNTRWAPVVNGSQGCGSQGSRGELGGAQNVQHRALLSRFIATGLL